MTLKTLLVIEGDICKLSLIYLSLLFNPMLHLNYDFVLDLPFCHLNDASFNLAMYELTHGSLNYDNDGLDSLIFNPINQIGHNLSPSYLDPDINFPSSSPPSNYCGEGEVNLKISAEKSEPKFSILHCLLILIN